VRTYRLVPGGSSLETEVRSSLHPIHGRASELRGEVRGEFDADGRPRLDQPHGGWVEIPVQAIRSGSRLNDMEMQRRADARRHPTIRFEVTRVWPVDGSADRYRAAIDVSARGQTRRIEEDFVMKRNGSRLELEGEHTFDMRDFGVNPPRILTLKVEPEVKVRVRLVAEEQPG
jgi:polyisoprenoid-binding protein YceI